MKHANQLRIIGGEWRSRKLFFPDAPDLRPTPDRVRETIFNWVMPYIQGAHCLDLFAGSGALGLEALSRGARATVFVDQHCGVIQSLQNNLQLLAAQQRATVVQSDAIGFLQRPAEPFDLVFLDPPYQSGLMVQCIDLLEANHWLTNNALIYLEMARQTPLPELPVSWKVLKEKTAGDVAYYLAQRD